MEIKTFIIASSYNVFENKHSALHFSEDKSCSHQKQVVMGKIKHEIQDDEIKKLKQFISFLFERKICKSC